MTTQPTPKGAWKITFLLFLFMLVNFAEWSASPACRS